MTDQLTPDQIELLRSLPSSDYPAQLVTLVEQKWATVELSPDGGDLSILRTLAADTLLATIDSTREQALEEVERLAERLVSPVERAKDGWFYSTVDVLHTEYDTEKEALAARQESVRLLAQTLKAAADHQKGEGE